ncbi:MAG: aminoglycoside phosphotransferase family protein [Clostridia bacterium]|nr:aminoglycoside phosphotransferase family protein [Clostridia bacterium]
MKLKNIIAERATKTVYRDGATTVKLFNKDFPKAEVLAQAKNQALVEEIDINIPKLLEVGNIDGRWMIVSEYVEGTPLDVLMRENPDKIDEYLDKFVDLQILVHTKRCAGLIKLNDKMHAKIDLTELDDTVKYELHTRLTGMPKHNKVCHGDFNPSNVIVREDGEMFIIDWSHVTQGNASADVARTYLIFTLAGKKELAEKYMDLFCEKTGTKKAYVQKWLPIVAASQSVKGNPEEKELLLSWANVVEFE